MEPESSLADGTQISSRTSSHKQGLFKGISVEEGLSIHAPAGSIGHHVAVAALPMDRPPDGRSRPRPILVLLKSSAAKHDHRHESALFESVTDGSRTFGTFGLPGLDDASQREILREPRLSDFSPRPRKDCELPAAWLGTGRTRAEPPWGFCFSLESVRSTSGYSVSCRQIT